MRFLFILLISSFVFACSTDKKSEPGFDKDLKQVVKETHPDGSPKTVEYTESSSGELKGKLEYYPTKKPFREWHMDKGLLNGESRSYYEDGKPWSLNTYTNDTLNGPYTTWHANGQVYIQGQYVHGEPSGQWSFFKDDGTIARQVQY